jgi:hypothetical protein
MEGMIMRFSGTVIPILAVLLALPVESRAETVRITRNDCERLIRHEARGDVAYKPGVDVRGRKVVPAEGPDAVDMGKLVPDVLEFAIALNPLKGGAARFGETALSVGTIRFDMNSGQATLDGVPLTTGDTRKLLEECRARLRQGQ